MLEKYATIYTSKFDEFQDPQKRLDNIINTFFESDWTERGDASVFWSCFSLSFRSDRVKASFRVMYDGFRKILADEISTYIEAGIVAVTDPIRTADIIITLIEGLNMYRAVKGEDPKLKETSEYFRQTVKSLLKHG